MQTQKSLIPHHAGKHFLSNALEMRNHPINFVSRNAACYGDVFSFRFGFRKLYIMNEPELVQQILQKNHRSYRKAVSYRKLKRLLGEGLFTSEGETWLKNRRNIQPSFHKNALAHFAGIMAGYAEDMTARWNQQTGQPLNLLDEMSFVTLQMVTKCLLGAEVESEIKVVKQHLPVVLELMMKYIFAPFNLPGWMPTADNRAFNRAYGQLAGLIVNIISRRRASGEYGNDMLSALLQTRDPETGQGLSDQQLIDEVLTFFLAGHETSAVAATWIFYVLALHPEVETRLRQEIDTVLQGRLPGVADLPQLVYTRNVIQETMRLYPPVWVVAREATESNRVGNYDIVKGESLVSYIYLIHRNPRWWKEPEKFNPDRFNEPLAHPFAYLPFGGGPRLCIGNHFAMMELQILLATVLQKCLLRIGDREHPGYSHSLTLRPQRNILIETQKR